MNSEMMLKALRALADPTRLHITEFLAGSCCGRATLHEDGGVESPTAGEVCCHITGADRINSTISHHLHELEEAGLIRIQRRGKTMLCMLDRDQVQGLASALMSIAKGETKNDLCC